MKSKIYMLLLTALLLIAPAAPAALAEGGEGAFAIQFSGVIDTVTPWQVAGRPVATDENTRIVLSTGTAAPGMWATVQARRTEEGGLLAARIAVHPAEMRLKGPVQAKPEDGLGAWQVAGQQVLVTTETRVNLRPGPIEAGAWVEVIAVEGAGGLVARRIQAIEADENIEVHGALQAFGAAWQISGVPLASDPGVLVIGEPEVGLLATALATLQEDNATLLARTVRVHWVEPERNRQPVQLRGAIEALPANGLVGAWTVNGKTVNVTEATRVFQIKGMVAIGAEVHVVGWQQGDAINATVVTVLKSPVQGGRRFQLQGEIVSLPPGGMYGVWVIDVDGEEVEVLVHLRTRIEGREAARVGATVEAGGVQTRDGIRLTTWLRVQGHTGGGPGPGPN